jgi:hypothetical protein
LKLPFNTTRRFSPAHRRKTTKRKFIFLLIPVLLLTFGVTTKLSQVGAEAQPIPAQKEEPCNKEAAQEFVACQNAAADETQRQQCRDYFACLRDVCAAIRKGEGAKACKPPFMF